MPSSDRRFAETLSCLLVGELFRLRYNGVVLSFNFSDYTIFQAELLSQALKFASSNCSLDPPFAVQSPVLRKFISDQELGHLAGDEQLFKIRLLLIKHYYLLEFHQCSKTTDFDLLPVKLRGKDQAAIVCYATGTRELDLGQEVASSFLINQMTLFKRRHLGRGQVQLTPPLFPRHEPIAVEEWSFYAERLEGLFLAVTEPLLAIHRAFLAIEKKIDSEILVDPSGPTGRLEIANWLASKIGPTAPSNLCKTNSLLFGKVLRRIAEVHKVGLRVHGRLPIRIVSKPEVRLENGHVDSFSKRQRMDLAEAAEQTSLAAPELAMPSLFHLIDCPVSDHCDCLQRGIRVLKTGEPVVLNVAEMLLGGWSQAVDKLLTLCERNKAAYFGLKPAARGEQVRLISGGLYMQLHKDNDESYAHYNNVVLPTLTRVCAPLCLGAWDQPGSDAFLFSIQAFTASYLSNSKEASPNGQTPHTDLPPTSQPISPFTILISGVGGAATRYLARPPELAKDQLGQLFMQFSVKEIAQSSKPFVASGHFEAYQIVIFSATDLLHFAPPHNPVADKRQNFFQMAVLLGTQLDSYNGDNQNLPLSLLLDHLERQYGPRRAINHPAVFRLLCQADLDGYDPSTAWTQPRQLIFQELRKAYQAAGRQVGRTWKPSSALQTRWAAAWLQ
jgi:hypothetical protein